MDHENYSPNFHHVRRADDETFVDAVLEALAAASGQSAANLGVCLYDAIDPDALNDLFTPTTDGPARDAGRVAFTLGEFAVDVHASGHVFVRRAH